MNWTLGAFRCVFAHDDHTLSLLEHRPTGDKVVIEKGNGITEAYDLIDGWSDTRAALTKSKPLTFKLADFFGPKEGPTKIKQWTGKCAELVTLAKKKEQDIIELDLASAAPEVDKDQGTAKMHHHRHHHHTHLSPPPTLADPTPPPLSPPPRWW